MAVTDLKVSFRRKGTTNFSSDGYRLLPVTKWDYVEGKPSTFTPSSHGNGSHTSTFLDTTTYSNYAAKKFVSITTVSTPTTIGTAYADYVVRVTSAVTVTVNTGWTLGSQLTILNDSTGTVTINPGTAVYMNGSNSDLTITSRYSAITLVLYYDSGSAEYWVAMGA